MRCRAEARTGGGGRILVEVEASERACRILRRLARGLVIVLGEEEAVAVLARDAETARALALLVLAGVDQVLSSTRKA